MPEPQNGWFGVTSDNEWFVIIRQPNSDEYLMVYENGGYDVGTVSEVFDESEHDFNRYGECTDGNKIIRLINAISFEYAKCCPVYHKDIIWERGDKAMAGVNILPIPSVYVSLSELKNGDTFTFRYGDREHRFTDHIYMCVDENYVGERIVVDLTVFNCFYIGNYEAIDVRRVKYKIVAEDDKKEIVEKLYDVMSKKNSTV